MKPRCEGVEAGTVVVLEVADFSVASLNSFSRPSILSLKSFICCNSPSSFLYVELELETDCGICLTSLTSDKSVAEKEEEDKEEDCAVAEETDISCSTALIFFLSLLKSFFVSYAHLLEFIVRDLLTRSIILSIIFHFLLYLQ